MVFTNRETRKLSKSLTFQYEGVLYQVDESKLANRLRDQKIEIKPHQPRRRWLHQVGANA